MHLYMLSPSEFQTLQGPALNFRCCRPAYIYRPSRFSPLSKIHTLRLHLLPSRGLNTTLPILTYPVPNPYPTMDNLFDLDAFHCSPASPRTAVEDCEEEPCIQPGGSLPAYGPGPILMEIDPAPVPLHPPLPPDFPPVQVDVPQTLLGSPTASLSTPNQVTTQTSSGKQFVVLTFCHHH